MKHLIFGHCCCMCQHCTVCSVITAMLNLSCKECLSLNMYANCAKSPSDDCTCDIGHQANFQVFKLLFSYNGDEWGCRWMSAHYHLMSAVINACSLLVLCTDIMMQHVPSLSPSISLYFFLSPRNRPQVSPV